MANKTFGEKLNNKPSAALRAMRDGLKKASKRPDFKVDMWSFGHKQNEICYGCAATCAVNELTNGNEIKRILGTGSPSRWDRVDIGEFENAIDNARCGNLQTLFDYMGVIDKHKDIYDNRFFMGTEDWRQALPAVTKLAKLLAARGL